MAMREKKEKLKDRSFHLREVCDNCGKFKPAEKTEAPESENSEAYLAVYQRWGCHCHSASTRLKVSGSDASASALKELIVAADEQEKERQPIETKLEDDKHQAADRQTIAAGSVIQAEDSACVADRWRVITLLDSDYLGQIFQAEDKITHQRVRLRILNPVLSSNRRIAKRFLQEAQKSSRLTHRNIAMVLDYGRLPEGGAYVVTEHIEGKTLLETIQQEGFLDTEETLSIWLQLCEALEEAHAHGVLHRGIKPSCIIVEASGNVKIIDFGLEKSLPPAGKVTQAISTILRDLGDPRYMSPEQCLAWQIDQRSDIYALGCVIYEALTGKKIFYQYKGLNVIMAHAQVWPDRIADVMYNSEVPPAVEAVLMKTLEKTPEHRYQSMKDLRSDIECIMVGKKPQHVDFQKIAASEANYRSAAKAHFVPPKEAPGRTRPADSQKTMSERGSPTDWQRYDHRPTAEEDRTKYGANARRENWLLLVILASCLVAVMGGVATFVAHVRAPIVRAGHRPSLDYRFTHLDPPTSMESMVEESRASEILTSERAANRSHRSGAGSEPNHQYANSGWDSHSVSESSVKSDAPAGMEWPSEPSEVRVAPVNAEGGEAPVLKVASPPDAYVQPYFSRGKEDHLRLVVPGQAIKITPEMVNHEDKLVLVTKDGSRLDLGYLPLRKEDINSKLKVVANEEGGGYLILINKDGKFPDLSQSMEKTTEPGYDPKLDKQNVFRIYQKKFGDHY